MVGITLTYARRSADADADADAKCRVRTHEIGESAYCVESLAQEDVGRPYARTAAVHLAYIRLR